INPLFPAMAEDLNLTLQDQGLIAGVLALTWGMSGILAGNLTDRIGVRKVLVFSVVGFSLLVAFTGLATGLITLLIIRALMGFAEGGYVPSSIVATVDASKPSRLGMNIGIQQMAMPFFGLFIGPLLAVGLLHIMPGWEYVFGILAIPGLIVAWLLWKNIKPRPPMGAQTVDKATNSEPTMETAAPSIWEPLKNKQILVITVAMFCMLTTLHVLATFMPMFITSHLGQSLQTMGFVMASLGAGGVIGMVAVPTASDKFGRKKTIVTALTFVCIFFAIWVFSGSNSIVLMAVCLFFISLLNSGTVATIIGPLINETVPKAIVATSIGLVGGLSEIVGGALAPTITGGLADTYGVAIVPNIVFTSAVIGTLILAFGLKGPAPKTS
ncbi:MAG: MFS transporter, partial [Pseudomonadota bacterium]